MPIPFIATAREQHLVRTPDDYLRKHAAFIERQQRAGARYAVHDSAAPVVAWVDHNEWKVLCGCGAANATHPEWGLACCYGCGAVHRTVVFPADVAGIEAALLKRGRPSERHWFPGETVDTLNAENIAAGIEAA